jgi:hypothetical protein
VSVTVSLLTCSLHSSARGIVRKEEAPNPQEIEKSHFGFHQYRSSIKKVPKVGTVMLSKKKTNARLSSCLLIRIPELKAVTVESHLFPGNCFFSFEPNRCTRQKSCLEKGAHGGEWKPKKFPSYPDTISMEDLNASS